MIKIDAMMRRKLRAAKVLLTERLYLPMWFPHLPLSLLVFLGGYLLLDSSFSGRWSEYLGLLLDQKNSLNPNLLPPLLIGSGLLLMASGLLFRSRLAWVIALLLASVAVLNVTAEHQGRQLAFYFSIILGLLFLFWRHFDRSSVAASTLFALTAVIMLLGYSTFGAYYLGDEFNPAIEDLGTAFYWAMVTMSTVGYGDISPASGDARLFAASVIILGVAVFATALTAVIAPLVSKSLARIVNNQGAKMKREKHFVVIGHTPLAANTAQSLQKRGMAVTRLFRHAVDESESQGSDYLVGEPSSLQVLKSAGVAEAEAVLAMLADDSENAFVVLAVRELAPHVETIVSVNDASHLDKIKLVNPNVLITPQLLGSELTAMLLSGEEITADVLMKNTFERLDGKK